jgi:hypothetical protein
MAVTEQPSKFTHEYYDYDSETKTKKLSSRWHYDLKKFPYGPTLVEEFNLPAKEKKKRTKKVEGKEK